MTKKTKPVFNHFFLEKTAVKWFTSSTSGGKMSGRKAKDFSEKFPPGQITGVTRGRTPAAKKKHREHEREHHRVDDG